MSLFDRGWHEDEDEDELIRVKEKPWKAAAPTEPEAPDFPRYTYGNPGGGQIFT